MNIMHVFGFNSRESKVILEAVELILVKAKLNIHLNLIN